MSQEAFVTVAGYATADPKLNSTARTNTPVTHVRVACTPRRVDRETGEWKEAPTSYFNVTCWRKLAIGVAASVHKGDPVIVRGRFRTRTWSDQDRTRTEIEIEADAMGHDLNAGWSHFLRDRPGPNGATADQGGGETMRQLTAADQDIEEAVDGHAERSSEGPDDGAAGDFAAGAGPRTPIAPAEGADESDIFAERPMVELDQELDEVAGYATQA